MGWTAHFRDPAQLPQTTLARLERMRSAETRYAVPFTADEPKRGGHAWALAAPILVGGVAWLVGLFMFDVLGAGYLRSFFGRLLRLIR